MEVEEWKKIQAGDPVCILSAAKMETIVTAPRSGTLKRVIVKKGERLTTGDLLIEISFLVYSNKQIIIYWRFLRRDYSLIHIQYTLTSSTSIAWRYLQIKIVKHNTAKANKPNIT